MAKTASNILSWNANKETYMLTDRDNPDGVGLFEQENDWFDWLEHHKSFAFQGKNGRLSLQKETRPSSQQPYHQINLPPVACRGCLIIQSPVICEQAFCLRWVDPILVWVFGYSRGWNSIRTSDNSSWRSGTRHGNQLVVAYSLLKSGENYDPSKVWAPPTEASLAC